MPLIGLTGGYASGKSLALMAFQKLGAYVIDCDQLAREEVKIGSEGLEMIKSAFGDEVTQKDGSLDRGKMAELVFANEANRKKLEGILHPLIISRVFSIAEAILAEGGDRVVVVDAPLLYEAGMDIGMDAVVVVTCPLEEQIRRGMARDKLGRGEVLARINAQAPLAEKANKADFIIDNSGGPGLAQDRVARIWKEINAL